MDLTKGLKCVVNKFNSIYRNTTIWCYDLQMYSDQKARLNDYIKVPGDAQMCLL